MSLSKDVIRLATRLANEEITEDDVRTFLTDEGYDNVDELTEGVVVVASGIKAGNATKESIKEFMDTELVTNTCSTIDEKILAPAIDLIKTFKRWW